MKLGETKIVNPLDIIKASRRFDLIFKYELAKAWKNGSEHEIREAEEAYLEMVRARNGFYEDDPPRDTPEDFLSDFRKTASSIASNGYDMSRPPIPVDGNMEILNGAHRLASCAAYGFDCPVVGSDIYRAGGSEMKTFLKGRIHPAVVAWGVSRYLAKFPDGALAGMFRGMGAHSGAPFPDWTRRNRRALIWKITPAIELFWLHLTLPFKHGAKKTSRGGASSAREKRFPVSPRLPNTGEKGIF